MVSLIGGLLGMPGGLGYAWLMLVGLPHLVAGGDGYAVSAAFCYARELGRGFWIGVVVSLVTIAWSLRQLRDPASGSFCRRSNGVGRFCPCKKNDDRQRTPDSLGLLARLACLLVAVAMVIARPSNR